MGRVEQGKLMKYRFEIEAKNYEDFASGRVLYNRKGATAFPVRLGSEIIQRCLERVRKARGKVPLTIYDPCCGGAYLLTTIALLHGREFSKLYASDVDGEILELAKANLALLTPAGMARRIAELEELFALYGKDSHREALASASRLGELVEHTAHLEIHCMEIDVLRPGLAGKIAPQSIDIVITDVPYGSIASWSQDITDPIGVMLSNLRPAVRDQGVVALVTTKQQKVQAQGFKRLEGFKIGKRSIYLLEPES
ncbi:MAG TPA: hypothetical protein GX008_07740 [Firmicutes bacterium]|nr:hypothetical protein [Bacillota bacterium]